MYLTLLIIFISHIVCWLLDSYASSHKKTDMQYLFLFFHSGVSIFVFCFGGSDVYGLLFHFFSLLHNVKVCLAYLLYNVTCSKYVPQTTAAIRMEHIHCTCEVLCALQVWYTWKYWAQLMLYWVCKLFKLGVIFLILVPGLLFIY